MPSNCSFLGALEAIIITASRAKASRAAASCFFLPGRLRLYDEGGVKTVGPGGSPRGCALNGF